MLRDRASTFFSQPRGTEVPIGGFTGEMNTSFSDLDIASNVLSGGQNMVNASLTSIKKRGGRTLYNQFLGTTTGILGGFAFSNNNTQENLTIYDTGVYRDVSNVWTALTSVTMTTNKPADFAYFPLTGKAYIVNQTDNVVKYTAGASSGDQTDGSFKKGKYIEHFKNRLLVGNVSSQADYVWYTDLGLDTFGTNNYFRVGAEVTGIINFFDRVLISSKKRLYRLQNFTFSGTAAGPESVDPLPSDFAAIYDRTMVKVNNLVYFLGQDIENIANIYVTDGYTIKTISDQKIRTTLAGLSATQLANACAGVKGNKYVLAVPESGQTTNTMVLVYDSVFDRFLTPQFSFIKGRCDFTCFWSVETNGQWSLYGGSAGTGQVYKLDANDGLYDEIPEERYLTSGSYNVPINGNPAKRASQSFKLTQYQSTQSINLSKIAVLLKKNTGTTTDLTVRIETDNNGVPSGTLVTNGSATITAFSTTAYTWKTVAFTTAPVLLGNTRYWLVIQHVTEGSGTSQYHWLADSCTATYTAGNLATYAGALTGLSSVFNPSSTATTGTPYGSSESATFSSLRSSPDVTALLTGNSIIPRVLSGSFIDVWDSLYRSIVLFDTASLPDDAVITSATISLYCYQKTNALSQSVGVVASTPASSTTLAGSDYPNLGTTRLATDISIDSLVVNAYNNFTLNASGRAAISVSGVSKFGLRLSCDIDNIAPTWVANSNSYASFRTYGGANPPVLTVNYTSAAGAATWTSDPVSDADFIIYPQSAIDGYADSKANLVNEGKPYQLQRFQTVFSTSGNYNVEVGFSAGDFASFQSFPINLTSTTTATWNDGTAKWNDGVTVWNGANARSFDYVDVYGFQGRTLKQRVRNRNANQQFEYNRTNCVITKQPRQV